MWFLIRSAFWLSLVFSAIEWPADKAGMPDARAVAATMANAATTSAASFCASDPRACLEAARKIQGLQQDFQDAAAARPAPVAAPVAAKPARRWSELPRMPEPQAKTAEAQARTRAPG